MCALAKSTPTVPCRSVHASTLRTPWRSCSSRSAASATGHRPITGCRVPLERASAILRPPPATARSRLATKSLGRRGASPAAVTIKGRSGAWASDQRMPASTPPSGPTKPAMGSATTGKPRPAKRSGSPLALSTSALTCGASRSITCSSMDLPSSANRPLSPPPMRRDCPPAKRTPVTGVFIIARSTSLDGLGNTSLARMPAILVADLGQVGVEHNALRPGERHEALAACPSDQGQAGPLRQLDAPGGETRARDEHGNAHLDRLDHHLGGEASGGVENLVLGLNFVEEHVAGDLVDGVVSADVLHVDQWPVLLAEHAAMNGPRLEVETGLGIDQLRQFIKPARLDAGAGVERDLVDVLHQVAKHRALRAA